MRGYVAVGHGKTPTGTFDPGAVSGSVLEYNLAFEVVKNMMPVLDGRVDYDVETVGGPGHDPDYRGSVAKINSGGYDWAIEVHFDWSGAPRGGFGLWQTGNEFSWCSNIQSYYFNDELFQRPNDRRTDLYFLNAAKCPTIIWECDRVGADITQHEIKKYGECIAAGTLRWLKLELPSTGGNLMPVLDICTDPNNGDYWVLTDRNGGVGTYNANGTPGNRYFGNLIDHPEYNAGGDKPNGPAVGIEFWNVDGGGYVIFCDDGVEGVRAYHFDKNTRK